MQIIVSSGWRGCRHLQSNADNYGLYNMLLQLFLNGIDIRSGFRSADSPPGKPPAGRGPPLRALKSGGAKLLVSPLIRGRRRCGASVTVRESNRGESHGEARRLRAKPLRDGSRRGSAACRRSRSAPPGAEAPAPIKWAQQELRPTVFYKPQHHKITAIRGPAWPFHARAGSRRPPHAPL